MKKKDEILLRISQFLMLQSSFSNNLGLLNGKMGIVLFFYHYAKYSGKKIYSDFAGELINEIYQEIHYDFPINFQDGLCGIAWGIEYIIQNRFVDIEPSNILEDIDIKIMEWDIRKIYDYSLETGVLGVAYYAISRNAGRKIQNNKGIQLYRRPIFDEFLST